ncbi:hypothetical protein AB0M02_28445 [Actinoplanes sp. NPDC051861]|uniref:hypothetical protein n=1 Tax=Actinoplanes sp. NPDC051861 TaxID=3155170 RepID=UPI0034319AEB
MNDDWRDPETHEDLGFLLLHVLRLSEEVLGGEPGPASLERRRLAIEAEAASRDAHRAAVQWWEITDGRSSAPAAELTDGRTSVPAAELTDAAHREARQIVHDATEEARRIIAKAHASADEIIDRALRHERHIPRGDGRPVEVTASEGTHEVVTWARTRPDPVPSPIHAPVSGPVSSPVPEPDESASSEPRGLPAALTDGRRVPAPAGADPAGALPPHAGHEG